MKRYFLVFLMLGLGAISAMASASGFTNFDSAGADAQDIAISGMGSWKWIIAFIPLGFGIFSAMKMNEYLNQKDEGQGQNEPKATRYAKVLGAGIVGVLIIYILLGLIGKVFAGEDFGTTWSVFVTDFWSQLFTPTTP